MLSHEAQMLIILMKVSLFYFGHFGVSPRKLLSTPRCILMCISKGLRILALRLKSLGCLNCEVWGRDSAFFFLMWKSYCSGAVYGEDPGSLVELQEGALWHSQYGLHPFLECQLEVWLLYFPIQLLAHASMEGNSWQPKFLSSCCSPGRPTYSSWLLALALTHPWLTWAFGQWANGWKI